MTDQAVWILIGFVCGIGAAVPVMLGVSWHTRERSRAERKGLMEELVRYRGMVEHLLQVATLTRSLLNVADRELKILKGEPNVDPR